MRRRTRRVFAITIVVIAIAAAIVLLVFLRKRAAPEAARLLPDADAFVYVNLRPLRRAGVIGQAAPVTQEAEYQSFVRETGFEFERDLDEAAFAVHPAGTPGAQTRFSEIFIGRIDTQRATQYFRKISRSVETYRNTEIFNIPVEDRTVRVSLLGADIAAVSNVEDEAVIHGMIDRYKQVARPFGGPALVRDYYKQLPFGTIGWTIARVPAAHGDRTGGNMLVLPGGFDLFFPPSTVIVGSVRWAGEVKLRAEAFTPGEDEARRITEQAGSFLALFQALESNAQLQGPDQDVKAFFDSLKVQQEGSRAILLADVPVGFLRKLLAEQPASELPGLAGKEPEQSQEPAEPRHNEKRRGKKQ